MDTPVFKYAPEPAPDALADEVPAPSENGFDSGTFTDATDEEGAK